MIYLRFWVESYLILKTLNDAHDVFIDDDEDNLSAAGDFTLDNSEDIIMFIQFGGGNGWLETSRSNNK